MKTTMRTILLFLLILCMLVPLTGCGTEEKRDGEIENLLAEFEYACSTLDIDAALNCIDPKMADGVKLAGGFISQIFGRDINEMFDGLLTLFNVETGVDATEFFGTMQIALKEVSGLGEQAAASTVVTYEMMGQKIVRNAVFRCKYYVDRWYIADFAIK